MELAREIYNNLIDFFRYLSDRGDAVAKASKSPHVVSLCIACPIRVHVPNYNFIPTRDEFYMTRTVVSVEITTEDSVLLPFSGRLSCAGSAAG